MQINSLTSQNADRTDSAGSSRFALTQERSREDLIAILDKCIVEVVLERGRGGGERPVNSQ